MRILFLLIVAFLLLFLGISTIFVDFTFVGKIGEVLGRVNRHYFGLLSYIYPFVLILALYYIYRKDFEIEHGSRKVLGGVLLFLGLILLEALILPKDLAGAIGFGIRSTLAPYIGLAGLWLLLVLILVAVYLLLDIKEIQDAGIEKLKDATIKKDVLIIDAPASEDVKESEKETSVKESESLVEESVKPAPLVPPKKTVKLVGEEKKEQTTKPKSIRTQISKQSKEPEPLIHEPEPKQQMPQRSQTKNDQKPTQIKIVKELEENKKLLESIEKGSVEKPQDFKLPPIKFLQEPPKRRNEINEAEIDRKVKELLQKLKQFKIEGDVVRTYSGPLVTTFEFKPAPNIKVSKILGLQDDLAMALKAQTIRIQAPIPGKDVVGIEIPNSEFETIYLREIIESDIFKKAASPLTMALGKDIVGKPFVTDLKKLPHLLIAGTTGSGKSVGINSMVVSLLYRNSPDRLKFMMIDPKMLEFSIYNDIPHLLTPVITNAKQAVVALSNMVAEMERRYQLMSQYKTKNIEGFNKKAKKEGLEELPYIVVIIDELADLMMTSGKDVEYSIARLAQMARAAGIHLIVATQRPSVDVVTGLIKANLPARISFRVGQKIDSKVILDSFGAESLLGRGDMLFTPPGASGLIRLHAPWVSESEIEQIVEFLKAQREPQYDPKFLAESIERNGSELGGSSEDLDELYEEAKRIVLEERKTSISYLQRRLQIGYNRAARIVEQLEQMGVLSPPNAKGAREILL